MRFKRNLFCAKARALSARYETRVGSPLDFQPKRVSAPSCLRALTRSAQAGRRAFHSTQAELSNPLKQQNEYP